MFPVYCSLALALVSRQSQISNPVSATPAPAASQSASVGVTPLAFREFFAPGQRELTLSPKLVSLNGRRVRIVGFMAQTEAGFKGGFYLCPRPIFCDEEAGGDADIPPESVFVVLRSARGKEIAPRPRALEATGILELGAKQDEEGHVTRIRLLLDKRQPAPSLRKTINMKAVNKKTVKK